ncbi:hypothetical protein KB559_11005 [Paenibacillus sp. Marseille-P2973]|uniref:hypothetical protein n=1 Tax=Paenibacillus sp. Marseille-P2973 TaxID=1871032 RepID=UPI001B3737D8|nr:hypothetical protein [Paenibacillus sp. Marseille-P2973]MBQ4899365.1 hypothetical protein [Paenibacillus sp. Marseille-P2973]
MKAVPKVNVDGLYIEDVITDDTFTGVVPFYADTPATGPDLSPEIDAEEAEEQAEEEWEPAGYIVGAPVPAGLYLPRFDLAGWQSYQDAIAAANDDYQAAYADWSSQPEDERGEPPVYSAPAQPELWSEGLTPQEIKALHPPKEPTELELLKEEVADLRLQNNQQQEAIDNAATGLEQVKSESEEQQQTIGTLGMEQIKQDLSTLDLKQQNGVIGAELVKKDISILDMYMQNQVLGQMLAALELKLLAKGTGGEANVQ